MLQSSSQSEARKTSLTTTNGLVFDDFLDTFLIDRGEKSYRISSDQSWVVKSDGSWVGALDQVPAASLYVKRRFSKRSHRLSPILSSTSDGMESFR